MHFYNKRWSHDIIMFEYIKIGILFNRYLFIYERKPLTLELIIY